MKRARGREGGASGDEEDKGSLAGTARRTKGRGGKGEATGGKVQQRDLQHRTVYKGGTEALR